MSSTDTLTPDQACALLRDWGTQAPDAWLTPRTPTYDSLQDVWTFPPDTNSSAPLFDIIEYLTTRTPPEFHAALTPSNLAKLAAFAPQDESQQATGIFVKPPAQSGANMVTLTLTPTNGHPPLMIPIMHPITVGRARTNPTTSHYQIPGPPDNNMSRVHATISQDQGALTIHPLTPAGTFINNQPAHSPTPISNADILQLGSTTLTVTLS